MMRSFFRLVTRQRFVSARRHKGTAAAPQNSNRLNQVVIALTAMINFVAKSGRTISFELHCGWCRRKSPAILSCCPRLYFASVSVRLALVMRLMRGCDKPLSAPNRAAGYFDRSGLLKSHRLLYRAQPADRTEET
jgi:hypothetical protein